MAELDSVRELLRTTLQVAVPMWIDRLKTLPWSQVDERAKLTSQMIAEHGDDIQFKSKKRGETANAFNGLAEGLAALSFCPGGVKFLGEHWIAEHPEGVKQ